MVCCVGIIRLERQSKAMCDGQITLPVAIVTVGILLFIYLIVKLVVGYFIAKNMFNDFK